MAEESIYCKNPKCKKPEQKWNTILRHSKTKTCKLFYSDTDRELLQTQSKNLQKKRKQQWDSKKHQTEYNPKKRKEKYDPKKQKEEYNPKKRKEKYDPKKQKEEYNRKKRKEKHEEEYDSKKRKAKHHKTKENEQTSSKVRLKIFRTVCKFGPIFICSCCKRTLFKRGVRILSPTNKLGSRLKRNLTFRKYLTIARPFDENESLSNQKIKNNQDNSLKVLGKFFLCHSCRLYLEKGDMPPICAKNGLEYGEIPECLKLSDIEKQLIVKNLMFIKIRELRPTRMAAMNDRIVSCPIEDNDIIKEVKSLPRSQKNCGMVTVKLKRRMKWKTYHKMGLVRPDVIFEALNHLKENHPEYSNINIKDCDDWLNSKEDENDSECEVDDNSDETDLDENDENLADQTVGSNENEIVNQSDDNIFNAHTCLLPEDPLKDVIGKLFL